MQILRRSAIILSSHIKFSCWEALRAAPTSAGVSAVCAPRLPGRFCCSGTTAPLTIKTLFASEPNRRWQAFASVVSIPCLSDPTESSAVARGRVPRTSRPSALTSAWSDARALFSPERACARHPKQRSARARETGRQLGLGEAVLARHLGLRHQRPAICPTFSP